MNIALTVLIILLAVVLFAAAFVLLRTQRFTQPLPTVEPGERLEVDEDAAAVHLGEAIRCKTISFSETQPASPESLLSLHNVLLMNYPEVHNRLKCQAINEYSLLYTWPGKDPELDGVLLMAHQDVVPADPETLEKWEHAPFSGEIADGYVWGRGALDIKNQLIAILESVERLLKSGFEPRRTVYLAFGHDEEIGGPNGAKAIARHLEEQGVRLAAVLDEGMPILRGSLPGVEIPVALVGNCEKGYLTLKFSTELEAGHASTPPKQTAIGILAKALTRLEENPMPSHPEVMKPLFEAIGGAAPLTTQMAFANLWLFKGTINKKLSALPTTSAAIRTSTAVTIFEGGVKDNILPRQAHASVNFRLLPGDTIRDVCDHVRQVIGDERVQFQFVDGAAWEASPVSPTDNTAFKAVAETLQQVFGGIPAAPFMMLGATDSRHYSAIAENIYRFSPMMLEADDIKRVHGLNERISVEQLGNMVRFFTLLIQRWDAEGL